MYSLQELKNNILSLKPYIQENYDVDEIYIFGSYARKDQNENSDIDLLVNFKKNSRFTYIYWNGRVPKQKA